MPHESPTANVDQVYFGRYLSTVNQALRELRRRRDAAPSLSALSSRFDQREFVVVLVGASRDGHARFGCRLSGLEFEPLDDLPLEASGCWYVRREHVWEVLEQPWRFLADPARIELPPFGVLERPRSSAEKSRGPTAAFGPNPQESGRPKVAGSGL